MRAFMFAYFSFSGAVFLYKYADEIISVSDDVALDLTTNFSVPKSKVKTIHNPIIDIKRQKTRWA